MAITTHPTGIITAGTDVTLSCMVMRLSSEEIDVPLTAIVQLFDPFQSLLTTTTPSVFGSTFIVASTVSSFERDHSGNYYCTAVVISSNNNSFLIDSNASSNVTRVTVGEGFGLQTQMPYYYYDVNL